MKNKKVLSLLLCLLLIAFLSSCLNNNNVKEVSNYLDKPVSIYEHNSIRGLLKLTKEQNISYAGRFLDKNGILNICLVYNSANNLDQEELLKRIESVNSEGRIKIISAEFSIDELIGAQETLTKNMKRLNEKGLISVELDEERNRLVVGVKEINEEVKNEISKLVDMSLIIFEKGFPATFT